MRIAIREQLAALVLLTVLVSLAILSIPTWVYVNKFVVGVETDALSLAASLKASSVAAEIELLQTTTKTIATRLLLQAAFRAFYAGNVPHYLALFNPAKDLVILVRYGDFPNLCYSPARLQISP